MPVLEEVGLAINRCISEEVRHNYVGAIIQLKKHTIANKNESTTGADPSVKSLKLYDMKNYLSLLSSARH